MKVADTGKKGGAQAGGDKEGKGKEAPAKGKGK